MSPASPSPSAPQRIPVPERRRQANARRWKNAATVAAVVAATVVADLTFDVHGRVDRALQNRPALLKKYISAEFDTPFAQDRMAENIRYYQHLGVVDPVKVQKLAESLTRLDILVRLFSQRPSQISSDDFLNFVMGSDVRIVTSEGVSLHQSISDGDKTETRKSTDRPVDLSTHFLTAVVNDPNSPHKTDKNPHKLSIIPRTQGGGYHFSYIQEGKTFTFTVDFRYPN